MSGEFTSVADRLSAGARSLADRVPLILGDPRAYPREAMLLAAVAALALVLVALLLFLANDLAAARKARRRLGARRTRKFSWAPPSAVIVILMTFFVISALAPGTMLVSRNCGRCHDVRPAVDSWTASVHSRVSCYGCHAAPGLSGAMAATLRGIGRPFSASPTGAGGAGSVHSSSCMSCHEEVIQGVTEGDGVRMRHSDVIDVGMICVECHFDMGHVATADDRRRHERPLMDLCLRCHDGSAASAECETCHDGRPSDTPGLSPAGDTRTAVTCEGCHSAETSRGCVECHGLVLPHPLAFVGEHAGLSASDPSLCARCHETADVGEACACHSDVNIHGTYSEWFPRHGLQAREVWPGGCSCHRVDFCSICHSSRPF